MHALLGKWVVYALVPGNSNLQVIFIFRINQVDPSPHSRWAPSPLWSFVPHFAYSGNFKVWHHIAQSWRKLIQRIQYVPPTSEEEIVETLCTHVEITISKTVETTLGLPLSLGLPQMVRVLHVRTVCLSRNK